ncbi:MAG: hypothetical protein GY797_37435 [Deltaproteobacteria bacterium]|nr:hypothetical protein [Deltaproteobacteria bacterium]
MGIIDGIFAFLDFLGLVTGIFDLPYSVWKVFNPDSTPVKDKTISDWQYKTWQRIARSNQLTFSSNEIGTYMSIKGDYRGCFVSVKTLSDPGKIHTSISVEKRTTFDHSDSKTLNGLLKEVKKHRLFRGEVRSEPNGKTVYYNQPSIETNSRYITQLLIVLSDLALNYTTFVELGSEVIPTLQVLAKDDTILKRVFIQLLQDIENETTKRLGTETTCFLCITCLTICTSYKIKVAGTAITYYGCRTCGQSREFLEVSGEVVAILDNQLAEEQQKEGWRLHINWVIRRSLFDFDKVVIIQATDEEVERFAVQVGNDTDELRKPKYTKMRCDVSADCKLSENTIRVLRHTFGDVKIQEAVYS